MTYLPFLLFAYLLACAVYAWIPDTHPRKGLRHYRETRAAWREAETYGRTYSRTAPSDVYPSQPPR